MSYNWIEIFKKKTDKELFEILNGDEFLGVEARAYAEKELKRRNFDFDTIGSQRKKWTLEELVEEERKENNLLGFSLWYPNSRFYLMFTFLSGIILLLSILHYYSNIQTNTITNKNLKNQMTEVVVFLAMTIIGLILYFRKTNLEKKRKNKIEELKRELNKLNT